MEYPVLKITRHPQLHKSFSKPIVLHFHGECMDAIWYPYMEYILKTVSLKMAEHFISNQSVCVRAMDGIFILCKDNLDILKMKEYASIVLYELSTLVGQKIHFTFGYAKAMIMVEGDIIGILNSNKVGDDFLQSEAYRNSIISTGKESRIHTGLQLSTFEEFMADKSK